MIKEVIVVEGKDDITRVKAAVNCDVIATGGFAFGKKLLDELKAIEERRGIIIFTDPDYMGKQIRRRLTEALDSPKQAYLSQEKATLKDNIGIENALPEDIQKALAKAKPMRQSMTINFTKADMIRYGLMGTAEAGEKRAKMGEALGIGHGNGKQFLRRLNSFNITEEEFEETYREVFGE